MWKSLKRAGTVLALIGALAYSLHAPHVDSDLTGGTHHCDVCQTVGMTAPSGPPIAPLSMTCNDQVQPTIPSLIVVDFASSTSPRGPPTL